MMYVEYKIDNKGNLIKEEVPGNNQLDAKRYVEAKFSGHKITFYSVRPKK